MTPARVLITGSRLWACDRLADRVVASLRGRRGAGLVVVHGGCRGVDTAFGEACHRAGVLAEVHLADWDRHGRAAGPIRNQAMVDLGAIVCLAFHRDLTLQSGTADCCRRAIAAGIPTWLTTTDDGGPTRLRSI